MEKFKTLRLGFHLSISGSIDQVFDRAVDGHIKNIRKKIKKYSDKEYIKTVYGLGYKLVGDADE